MRNILVLCLLALLILLQQTFVVTQLAAQEPWALEETFDGDPTAPSQAMLPENFDFSVTHSVHPKEVFDEPTAAFRSDHDDSCAGPNPDITPLPQHIVQSSNASNGSQIDPSFFLCKNHMMSSMGDVAGYSMSAFWPRQAFDFADGGTLEFDVNINEGHDRMWWEVMIVPRAQLKVNANGTQDVLQESDSAESIIFSFVGNRRRVQVSSAGMGGEEIVYSEDYWASWRDLQPDDPANTDRRIRRTMRIELDDETLTWSIEQADGNFSEVAFALPAELPFTRGLVLFTTHAYTPEKADNYDTYTFHWDNIRFDGPVVGQYESYEADSVVYLARNGNRPINDAHTVTIDLPTALNNPILFGQLHAPVRDQVLVSINNAPPIAVNPYDYDSDDCFSNGWKSFQLPLDPTALHTGENTLRWIVGERPACASDDSWPWDGFAAKDIEIQSDGAPQVPAAVEIVQQPAPSTTIGPTFIVATLAGAVVALLVAGKRLLR